MKNLNFILLGLAFMGIFTFTSCGEDPEPEPEIVNIVETAQASDNLSMFVPLNFTTLYIINYVQ